MYFAWFTRYAWYSTSHDDHWFWTGICEHTRRCRQEKHICVRVLNLSDTELTFTYKVIFRLLSTMKIIYSWFTLLSCEHPLASCIAILCCHRLDDLGNTGSFWYLFGLKRVWKYCCLSIPLAFILDKVRLLLLVEDRLIRSDELSMVVGRWRFSWWLRLKYPSPAMFSTGVHSLEGASAISMSTIIWWNPVKQACSMDIG